MQSFLVSVRHTIVHSGTVLLTTAILSLLPVRADADTTPPADVTGLTAEIVANQIVLSWTNPTDNDFAGIMVRGKIGSYPTSPTDGVLILNDNVPPIATSAVDTQAFAGPIFHYTVYSYDAVPNYSAGATATASLPIPLPGSPTGLASIPGDTQVILTWSAVSGASSYNVKRALNSGGPYATIAAGITTTSHINTGLVNDTTYFFVVSAANSAGESANSTEISATPSAEASTTHILDDAASPISVTVNTATGRMTVLNKQTGTIWTQGTGGGGSVFAPGQVAFSSPTKLVVSNATIGGTAVTLTFELMAGELTVTLSNAVNALATAINYPYPFHTETGAGHALVPINSGHVVPTSTSVAFTLAGPLANRRMEFCGGTDAVNQESWVGIFVTPYDAGLTLQNSSVSGGSYRGTTVQWQGSNGNANRVANLLSYDRVIRYAFFSSGGYVAAAKRFRQHAIDQGWLKTLAEKAADNPAVLDVVGAPIIYLWGDGHDTAFLDQLKSAGIGKALLQLSVNHTDQFSRFPNQEFADGRGWFNAVRAHGYRAGFYDIYQAARPNPSTGYSGFTYLWPTEARNGTWAYQTAGGQRIMNAGAYDICATQQEIFAFGTRLPAHIDRFDMDAEFFDVLCARPNTECFDPAHFQTRSDDVVARAGVLDSAYSHPLKPLLTGTEQIRSWAVPYLVWGEGVQHLGNVDSQGVVGANLLGGFNGNAYPDITTNPVVLNSTQLGSLLSDGYQAPLWDLVYHDCVLSTLHWERAQNKFVYAWDHADLAAMLRGQTALLNLTYRGAQGSVPDSPPAIITDAGGNRWSMRWADTSDPSGFVRNRVLQTYNTVCRWHETVGMLEMIDHRRLTNDRTVQLAEFSADGGATGHGIIVNFGNYDGAFGKSGNTWTGSHRGKTFSVPVNGYATYDWDHVPPVIHAINASPAVLWPANHKMVAVSITAQVSDNVDASPTVRIVAVSSNESENGSGDGNTATDWEITGDRTVKLRAERSGGGGGRIYTITVECTDAGGNTSTGTVTVEVPHNK